MFNNSIADFYSALIKMCGKAPSLTEITVKCRLGKESGYDLILVLQTPNFTNIKLDTGTQANAGQMQ